MEKNLVIIGGGAAGLFSAIGALKKGVKPIIIEKMPRLGTKILITGKGRCNLTNAADDMEYFIKNMPGNGSFLYSAFFSFTNTNTLDLFQSLGLKTKIERGGRVFPATDQAKDVVGVLEGYLRQKYVKILLNTPVEELIIKKGKVVGVKILNRVIPTTAVIIATGGTSYPGTGSSGDGYKFAKSAGHNIVTPRPSLIPLETYEEWVKKVQGLTLKNVNVKIFKGSKKLGEEFGEMLFTHFGVSGPIILTLSRVVVKQLEKNKGKLFLDIDLKPALSPEKLDLRLQRDFLKYSRKQYKNSLDDLLPTSLIEVIIELSDIDPKKYVNQITKKERKKLISLLKNLRLTIKKPRPIKEAIVTAGGINVAEVDPGTMASKRITGLYFAGEVLDIDGVTGGFNLQAAFSTGYLAGISSAEYILNKGGCKNEGYDR